MSNRTLLWKYTDDSICGQQPARQCQNLTKEYIECDRFLRLYEWIPAFQEWSKTLSLPEPTYLPETFDGLRQKLRESTAVVFPYDLRMTLQNSSLVSTVSKTKSGLSRRRMKMLYSEGTDFLYGLLMEKSIVIRDNVTQVSAPALQPPDPAALSLAVHISLSQDVETARECLKTILSNETRSCQLFVVNEYQEQTPHLETNCTFFWGNYSAPIHKNLRFFHDMAFATDYARAGFIESSDSSRSTLIRERIEYSRRFAAWRSGRIPPILPEFLSCSPADLPINARGRS